MKLYIKSASNLVQGPITRDMYVAARDPNTSAAQLEELAELAFDEDSSLLLMDIASNPNTPVPLLVKLSHNDDAAIEVAENPSIPAYLMRNLSKHPNTTVRSALARNKNVSPDLLRRLASDHSGEVRRYAALNPNIPVDCLYNLATDYDVRDIIVNNPNADDKALAMVLPKLRYTSDLVALVNHPNVSSETLSKVIDPNRWTNRGYGDVYIALLQNPKTSYETLLGLLQNEDAHFYIARYSTDPRLLDAVSDVCKSYYQTEVAKNPNTSSETLAKLAKSRNSEIKQAVASNPNTDPETLANIQKNLKRSEQRARKNSQ